MFKLKINRGGNVTYLRCYSHREAVALQARIMQEHDTKTAAMRATRSPLDTPSERPSVKILNLSAR